MELRQGTCSCIIFYWKRRVCLECCLCLICMSVADVDVPGASDVWTRCYAYSITHCTNVCAIPIAYGKIYFFHSVSGN